MLPVARIHVVRIDELEVAGTFCNSIRRKVERSASDRLADAQLGGFEEPGVCRGIVSHITAITAKDAGGHRGCRSALPRAVVLRAPQIGVTVGIRNSVIELRGYVIGVQLRPGRLVRGDSSAADLVDRRCQPRSSVVGAEDATIVGHEHRLVARAVVLRVEDNHVLIRVGVERIALRGPPVIRRAKVRAPVVRAEQINTANPNTIGIYRIDGDHLVIPALGQDCPARSDASRIGEERIGQENIVDRHRIRGGPVVGHLRRPASNAAVGRGAEYAQHRPHRTIRMQASGDTTINGAAARTS